MNVQYYADDGLVRLFAGRIVIDIKPSFNSAKMTPKRAANQLRRMGLTPGKWKQTEWGCYAPVAGGWPKKARAKNRASSPSD